jgi:hypothetical protein
VSDASSSARIERGPRALADERLRPFAGRHLDCEDIAFLPGPGDEG